MGLTREEEEKQVLWDHHNTQKEIFALRAQLKSTSDFFKDFYDLLSLNPEDVLFEKPGSRKQVHPGVRQAEFMKERIDEIFSKATLLREKTQHFQALNVKRRELGLEEPRLN